MDEPSGVDLQSCMIWIGRIILSLWICRSDRISPPPYDNNIPHQLVNSENSICFHPYLYKHAFPIHPSWSGPPHVVTSENESFGEKIETTKRSRCLSTSSSWNGEAKSLSVRGWLFEVPRLGLRMIKWRSRHGRPCSWRWINQSQQIPHSICLWFHDVFWRFLYFLISVIWPEFFRKNVNQWFFPQKSLAYFFRKNPYYMTVKKFQILIMPLN